MITKKVNFIYLVFLLSLLFSISGCYVNRYEEEDKLYDRPGFDRGSRPNGMKKYGYYGGMRMQQGTSRSGYRASAAGSRFYSNPYDIPPAGDYPEQYSDADDYYVPPNYYGNGEVTENANQFRY